MPFSDLLFSSVNTATRGTNTKAAPAPPGGDVNDAASEAMMSRNANQNYATFHLRSPVIIAVTNTWSPSATACGNHHPKRPTPNKSPSQSAVPIAAA
jgi:hypothetical protein